MYDATLFYRKLSRRSEWFSEQRLEEGKLVLVTIHRAENTDTSTRLAGILEGLSQSTFPVVLPLHPRTRARIEAAGIVPSSNICLVPPVGYLEMVWLENACRLIVSDSGGVQKEAHFHNRRCVILRDETEWVELVEAGWNVIVGADPNRVATAETDENLPRGTMPLVYGAGDAAERVVKRLIK